MTYTAGTCPSNRECDDPLEPPTFILLILSLEVTGLLEGFQDIRSKVTNLGYRLCKVKLGPCFQVVIPLSEEPDTRSGSNPSKDIAKHPGKGRRVEGVTGEALAVRRAPSQADVEKDLKVLFILSTALITPAL